MAVHPSTDIMVHSGSARGRRFRKIMIFMRLRPIMASV
jgi:hypothetical protein